MALEIEMLSNCQSSSVSYSQLVVVSNNGSSQGKLRFTTVCIDTFQESTFLSKTFHANLFRYILDELLVK